MARKHFRVRLLFGWAACLAFLLPQGLGAGTTIPDAPPGSRVVVATYFAELLPGLRAVAPAFKEYTGLDLVVQGIPYAQYRFWVQARFLAHDAPDLLILEGTTDPWQYAQAGLVMELGSHLNQANPFDQNAENWGTAFRDELLQFSYDANGNLFLLPFTQFGVGFFYNRTLYDRIGIAAPATWSELREVLDKSASSEVLRSARIPAMAVAVRPDDAQSLWMTAILLECFLRSRIPEVNLRLSDPDWEFDPGDPDSVAGERIDLSERVVAFSRGIIDPARSPEFREAVTMVKGLVPFWRPDFLSLSGEELYRMFASGRSLHFMNGTWFLKDIGPLQDQMREVAPTAAFEFGTFPFPELDDEWNTLARAGGINQNAGLRACMIIPRQPRERWREKAGIVLAQFLSSEKYAQVIFDKSNVYDLPAMDGVLAKPESQPLVPTARYPFLPLAYFEGYDSQAISEFWPAWQNYLAAPDTEAATDAFLTQLGGIHRRALQRLVASNRQELDEDFLREQLGADWEAAW